MQTNSSTNVSCTKIAETNISNNVTETVVEEKLFTLQIDQIGSFTLLCTPIDLIDLAIGFLFTEGIITSIEDVAAIHTVHSHELIIAIKLKNPPKNLSKRNLIVTSACGLCGKDNVENLLFAITPCQNTLHLSLDKLAPLLMTMEQQQTLFQQTGATHAAGIFNTNNEITIVREDVGRHNALDKAIGHCLREKIDIQGSGLLLSSRISFEMVVKAARAGLEMIIAVSAPTALAIKAAAYWNITLCGFVLDNKYNIYTVPQRLL